MPNTKKPTPRVTFTRIKDSLRILEAHRDLPAQPPDPPDGSIVFKSLASAWLLYTTYLEYCQIAIRHGLAEPKPQLRKAIALSRRCAIRWSEAHEYPNPMNPRRLDYVDFNFSLASLISLLAAKEVPTELNKVVPSVSAWRPEFTNIGAFPNSFTGVHSTYCDSGVLHILLHKRRPKYWSSILALLDLRTKVLYETYKAYEDIVLNAQKLRWSEAWDAVEVAHELYERRGRYYYNELYNWEGDRSSNEYFVDIRLTVLIHRCFPKTKIPTDSPAMIHRYRPH